MPKNYRSLIHAPPPLLAVIKRLKHNGRQQKKALVNSVETKCTNTLVFQTVLCDFKLQLGQDGAEMSGVKFPLILLIGKLIK